MAFVYRFKDKKTQEIIYVGRTGRTLETRMKEHFGERGHLSRECYDSVGRIEYIPMATKNNAILAEVYFINKYKPRFNKQDKGDEELTLDLEDIFEEWQLYCIMNKEEVYRSSFNLIEIIFCVYIAYCTLLTLIAMFFR